MKTDVSERETTSTARPLPAATPARSSADPSEMTKRVEAAGQPGPAHQALNALAGNWKAEVKCWHDPAGSPEITHGIAKANWKFGGRFLEEDFNGMMMGKPFTGATLLGYDNTKQTFNSVWVSDSQTSMFTSEGKGDSANKVITLEGKASCAATGRKDVPMKTVLRVLSLDKHTLEMFDGSQGNAKMMEITYTRS
jgi:hypothetical protein